MQRIEIDSTIRQFAIEYKKDVTNEYLSSIKKGLKKLCQFLQASQLTNKSVLIEYAQTILDMFETDDLYEKKSLLILEPQDFEDFECRNSLALSDSDLNTEIKIGKTTRLFHEWITYYLHYSDIRRYIYPKFLEKLKINTCVYCNSEFISTSHLIKQDENGNVIKDEKNEVVKDNKGRFQLDHFWPKSKHPFLSISFFNLQPSCNFCNLWKSDDDIPFNLFTNESNVPSPFNFFLSEEDAINYAKMHHLDCLKIHFKTTIENYEVFHIEEVYEPFKYEVEEMFWKKVSNGVSYLDMLKKSLPNDLMIDNDFLYRLFYGYYRDPRDILKRPLTKMKQDIAIQLEKLASKIKV